MMAAAATTTATSMASAFIDHHQPTTVAEDASAASDSSSPTKRKKAHQQLRGELKRLFDAYVDDVEQLQLTETCYTPLMELVQKTAEHIFAWTVSAPANQTQSTVNPSFASSSINRDQPPPSSTSAAASPEHAAEPMLLDEQDENVNTSAVTPPTFLVSHLHPHPLYLYESHHWNGRYRCNFCWHWGINLVYACHECKYDLHPECFQRNYSGPSSDYFTTTPLPNPDPEYKGTKPPKAAARIELEFPQHISREVPRLRHEAKLERMRMIKRFEKNPQFHIDPEFREGTKFSYATLQFLLDEWNNKHPDQSPLILTPVEGGVCLTLIEGIMSDILCYPILQLEELEPESRRPSIRPFDLLREIHRDEELSILTNFLNAPFHTIDLESLHRSIISSSAYWPSASNENIQIPPPHPFPRTTRFESMLDETFQPNVEQFKEINSLEWYFDPGQVKQYAQQYAELKLPPGDDYFYRQWGITPIAFYGGTLHGLSHSRKAKESEERVFTFSVAHPLLDLSVIFCFEIRSRPTHVIGKLWDCEQMSKAGFISTLSSKSNNYEPTLRLDKDWLEQATLNGLIVDRRKSTCVTPATAPQSMTAPAAIANNDASSSIMTDASLAVSSSSTTAPTTTSSPHLLEQQLLSLSPDLYSLQPHPLLHSPQMRSDWRRLTKLISDLMVLFVLPDSEKKKKSGPKQMSDSGGDEEKEDDDLPNCQQFPQALIATQLFAYELFPTGLWTTNHPLSVRHYFTQELIREQSRLAGLPELPNDLLHLIGEYEPARLPCPPVASTPLSQESNPCPWFTPAQLVQYDQYQRGRVRFMSHDCQIDESNFQVVHRT